MRVTYDPEADVLYLALREVLVDESEEVAPNVVIDLDAEGRAVGIEIGAASEQMDGNPLALSLGLRRLDTRDIRTIAALLRRHSVSVRVEDAK
jgi:uncharacterized protein YuzE